MPQFFLDTSALVKHYHAESGTATVDALWSDPAAKLLISRLSVVETVSVFAKKLRTGIITAKGFDLLRRRFFCRPPQSSPCYCAHAGSAFSGWRPPTSAARTYPWVVHPGCIATCRRIDLQRRGMLDEVVAADHVIVTLGPLEGLKVLNPEMP